MNIKICLILGILFISCGANKNLKQKEYKNSVKSIPGKLTNLEYNELKTNIEKEFKITIPKGKSILINYNQKATNCSYENYGNYTNSTITDNKIRISKRMSFNYNAIDFFVYTEDSFNKEIYSQKKQYRLDSGFFYNNIFTLHENCSGFLIIKPNGDFLKYYGTDYYTQVSEFLEKKN